VFFEVQVAERLAAGVSVELPSVDIARGLFSWNILLVDNFSGSDFIKR